MLQRLTERTFYGVPTLSGLPIRKSFEDYQAAEEDLSRADRMNELYREVTPKSCIVTPEVLEVHEVPSEEVRMVPPAPTATKVLFT